MDDASATHLIEQFGDWVSPGYVVVALLIMLGSLSFAMVVGTRPSRWVADAPFALFGFAAGNLVGYRMGFAFVRVGDVHVIEAFVGLYVALGVRQYLRRFGPPSLLRFAQRTLRD